jgi:hypothetical protein
MTDEVTFALLSAAVLVDSVNGPATLPNGVS